MNVAEWADIYGIHHWQILWSSYRKLAWVGFKPATTEFCPDPLTDWALRPRVQLALRANFVQLLQFNCLYTIYKYIIYIYILYIIYILHILYIYIYISTLCAFIWKYQITIYSKRHFLIQNKLYFSLFKNILKSLLKNLKNLIYIQTRVSSFPGLISLARVNE